MGPSIGSETPRGHGSPPPRPPGRTPGRTLSPRTAVLFVAGVAVLFFWGALVLMILLGEKGLPAAEWLLLFLPAVLFVRRGGFDVAATLSLRRPSGRALAGALLLVAGATPLGWAIGWLQTFFLPIPWELLEGLEEQIRADSPGRLAWLLLAVAVTPALCEEIVFRGVLLGGTRSLAPWRIVLLNGVVFGAFHLSIETPIRFLPTAWLGIVIAWAVLRSGSLWAGVLMHFLNNASIVLLASLSVAPEAFSDPNAPPPLWLVLAALAALSSGIVILGLPAAGAEPGEPIPST